MIKKLRRKFILINMALVSLILFIVFGVFCFSSYQSLRSDNIDALHRTISRKGDMKPPKLMLDYGGPKEPFSVLPIFCILIHDDESVEIVAEENAEASIELAKEAARLAVIDGKREGLINSLDLRYLKEETPEGIKIAFVERSNEKQSMLRIIMAAICLLIGGLLAFFLVSLYLAHWALHPVEKAWEQQRQFVADASHELKTPVTVILANSGILMAHVNETIKENKKWVENTQAEALRMKKLVDDLLFLAKNDSAQPRKCYLEVDFSFVILSSFLVFEAIAFEQGITLNNNIADNIFINGDKNQLQQLIVILLDNACKYVDAKGTVTVSLYKTQDKAKLQINNTGTAIAQNDLNKIFERFYRSDKSRAREAGGFGLGLAIAERITQQHRGRIEVESLNEKGTTFTVILPLITK